MSRTAVLLDLNVDSRTHAAYGTVVASRVRSREDLLILRPFPLWLFQRGAAEGPGLLLRKLRGDHIDWDALHEARWPRAPCQMCKELKSWDLFAHTQWELIRSNRDAKCLKCQRAENPKGPVKRGINEKAAWAKSVPCTLCQVTKVEEAFPRAQLAQTDAKNKRQCSACRLGLTELTCVACGQKKHWSRFSPCTRTLPDDAIACKDCQHHLAGKSKRLRSGWFMCRGCKESFLSEAFGSACGDHCLNCSQRTSRRTGWHTCWNRGCKKLFQSSERGLCPECQARARPHRRRKNESK